MTQQLILDLLPSPAPTLENFIVGKNAQAVDAVMRCAPGHAVYLWAASGAGRSHLLQAIGALPGSLYIHHSNAGRLLLELVEQEAGLPERIAIDSVERLDDEGQALLFALYNRWRESASSPQAFALILAGDRSPQAMPIREDLRTRLGWDLVFRLEHLSDEERAQALHAQATARGLQLAPEVVNWLLTHYSRDMSKLSALIDNLDRYSLERQRAVTLPLLREFMTRHEPSCLPN